MNVFLKAAGVNNFPQLFIVFTAALLAAVGNHFMTALATFKILLNQQEVSSSVFKQIYKYPRNYEVKKNVKTHKH
jgi:hypothetical protein